MSGRKLGLFNVREHLERVAKAVAVYHANGDTEEFKSLMAHIGIVNDRILRKHDITRGSGGRSDVYVNRVNGYGREAQ